jgi:L-threonylcarbamoyladenylate synthase
MIRGEASKAAAYINSRPAAGAAVLCYEEEASLYPGFSVLPYGKKTEPDALARNLFGLLRTLDKLRIETAYARYPEGEGLELAVQNRLNRAAGFRLVEV